METHLSVFYGNHNPDDGVCAYCLGTLVDGYRAERADILKEMK